MLQLSSHCQWFRLLTVCCQRFTHQPIVFCVVRPTHISLGLAMLACVQASPISFVATKEIGDVCRQARLCKQSLFFLLALPPSFLASRGFAAQRLPRACTPLTKSEEKERLRAVYFLPTEMTYFPTHSYTSTSEIPTISYT